MFEAFYKEISDKITVYNIRNDKNGYPQFLIYINNEWKYISAKHFSVEQPKKTLKVKCICSDCDNLTFKKEYKVLKSWVEKSKLKPYESYAVYLIIDDFGNKSVEPCCLFNQIE